MFCLTWLTTGACLVGESPLYIGELATIISIYSNYHIQVHIHNVHQIFLISQECYALISQGCPNWDVCFICLPWLSTGVCLVFVADTEPKMRESLTARTQIKKVTEAKQ